MTTCSGCKSPLEHIAQIRVYHSGCDPQGRVEMLERVLRRARDGIAKEIRLGWGVFSEAELAEIDAALEYRPAQMKGREG